MVKVSTPGKLILSGEHSVVHGYPALVAAIDRRLEITVDKQPTPPSIKSEFLNRLLDRLHELLPNTSDLSISNITSQIPIGSGLGSSAAMAVATSAAFYFTKHRHLDLTAISDLAYELEKLQHKTPSGVDNTICAYGGFLWYIKKSEQEKTFTPLSPVNQLPELLLIQSGTPQETTGDMVGIVRASLAENPQKITPLLSEISNITHEFRHFLISQSSTPLPQLITANEKLLETLGVVSPSTQSLIRQIEKLGGAAKISGAGGLSAGSGILLTYHPDLKNLQNFAIQNQLEYFPVKLGATGVHLET